jgi:hypothetical protein
VTRYPGPEDFDVNPAGAPPANRIAGREGVVGCGAAGHGGTEFPRRFSRRRRRPRPRRRCPSSVTPPCPSVSCMFGGVATAHTTVRARVGVQFQVDAEAVTEIGGGRWLRPRFSPRLRCRGSTRTTTARVRPRACLGEVAPALVRTHAEEHLGLEARIYKHGDGWCRVGGRVDHNPGGSAWVAR